MNQPEEEKGTQIRQQPQESPERPVIRSQPPPERPQPSQPSKPSQPPPERPSNPPPPKRGE